MLLQKWRCARTASNRKIFKFSIIRLQIRSGFSSIKFRFLCRSCFGRDTDRRVRREIANSNERRRMQSINAGFQSLRKLLQARDKDKLSKVTVPACFVSCSNLILM
jgi:Helix-loop-helix DNA-binding domain